MTLPVLSVLLAASLLAAQPSAVPAGEVGPAFGAGRSSSADSVVAQAPGLCDSSGVTQFSDVGSGDYGASYILCMRALGLSVGTGGGEFGAEGVLTRGQMASFLVRLWREVLGRSCPRGGTPFGDVAGNTHEDNIACLYNLGITKGTTATTYGPGETLKASQISRFLLRTYEKAGNRCPDRASELDEAAECLLSLRVVPDAEEARSSIAVTRARMAVYVVGLWHNLSGRGLPPEPPRQRLPDAMLPIPADLATEANVVTTGRMEVPVYICAPANRYRVAHLRTAVADLNREVSSFFGEQSSGEVDLRFTVGGIVSPAIDWGATNFKTIHGFKDINGDPRPSQHPCIKAATGQEGHRQVVVLPDVRLVGYSGFAWTGIGPAVQPMKHQFSSEDGYYYTVAHEVGHSRFGFCHTFEQYFGKDQAKCRLYDFHNANVYNPNDRSVMSYSGTGNLDTSHISCAHRAQAGWPAGPPLPGGQRCTGSGTGPQSTSVPNRPRNLSVTPGDGQLIVRWKVPYPPSGETWQWLSGYTVSFDNGQGDSGQRNVSDTWVIIAGLANGVEYTIEVTANNEIGAGSPSVTRATPGGATGVPGPPTNAAVVEGDHELTISWSAPSDDGGAPITGYTITSDDGSIDVTVGAGTRSRRIGGLTNGRRYTISVYAQNRNGMSQTPATVTATPIATQQVPDAPVVVVTPADVVTDTIEAHWSANDNGSPIDQWEIGTIGTIDESMRNTGTVSAGTTTYTWTNLERDTGGLAVRVRARNSAGWSEWGLSDFVTVLGAVPSQPTSVRVMAGDGEITVYWSPPTDDGGSPITGYELIVEGSPFRQATVSASAREWTFSGLTNGETYYVFVKAINVIGWGLSWEGTAIPIATQQVPDVPVVTASVSGSSITVSWSAYDNGSPIIQWEANGTLLSAGTTTYTWSNLEPGDWSVGVRARNAAGWSEMGYSNWVTIKPPAIPPDIPVVTAYVDVSPHGIQTVQVSWFAEDNGSSIIEWSFDCGWGPQWATSTTTAYAWTPDGLGDYSCDIRARNSAGWSEWGTSNTVTIELLVPDAPVVTASVSGRSITASWSANDNGLPIDQWEIRGVSGTVGAGTTTYTWTNQQPRDYVVRVRARNSAGWSEWGTSNTVTVESPTVILSRGDPGPTVAPRQGDVPCSRSSPDCRWLNIELRNFTPGQYRVYCVHDGFGSYSGGYWEDFTLTVDSTGRATSTRSCYINIAKAKGRGVIIRVGETSQLRGQTRWQSNWLR